MDLIIEGLASGKREYSVDLVDDFTGKAVERPITRSIVHKPLPNAYEIINQRKRMEAEQRRRQAQRTAQALTKVLTNMLDPSKPKPEPIKLAHNQTLTRSGLILTPKAKPKWRRV